MVKNLRSLRRVSKLFFLSQCMRHLGFFCFIVFLHPVKSMSGEHFFLVRSFLRGYNVSLIRIKGSFLKLSLDNFLFDKGKGMNFFFLKNGTLFYVFGEGFSNFLFYLKVLKRVEMFFRPLFYKVLNCFFSSDLWQELFQIITDEKRNVFIFGFFPFLLNFFVFILCLNFFLYRRVFLEFFINK